MCWLASVSNGIEMPPVAGELIGVSIPQSSQARLHRDNRTNEWGECKWDPRDQVLEQRHFVLTAVPESTRSMRTWFCGVQWKQTCWRMALCIYRHNQFTLTPTWCYRRGRDRLPYGAIRCVRDIQMDLNKRASKALFMLNTNQVIADKGAVDDPNVAMEEVHRPDGWIEKNAGKELTIRRDTDAATGQLQMMTLDAQTIQKSVGISPRTWGARPMRTQALPSRGARTKAASPPRSHSTTSCWPSRPGPETTEHGRAVLHRGKVIRLTGASGQDGGEDQPTRAGNRMWKRALPERHHQVHGRLRGVRAGLQR